MEINQVLFLVTHFTIPIEKFKFLLIEKRKKMNSNTTLYQIRSKCFRIFTVVKKP